ncbi:MAG: hypothetical protein ABF449_09130 [Ethanoligenens sp.]
MAVLKRRTRNAESIPMSVRYLPETDAAIREFAYKNRMTYGRANEELVLKGLAAARKSREAS